MKSSIRYIALTTLAVVGLTLGCGRNNQVSYSGPGSHWKMTVGGGRFELKKFATYSATTPDLIVGGLYTVMASGFSELTVDSVTGSGGPAIGDKAHGIEIPGFMFALKPLTSSDDQVIVSVESGNCPTGEMNANWVIVKKSNSGNMSSPTQDAFGTFTYSAGTGVASVATKYSLAAPTTNLGSSSFASATCTDGLMTVSNGGGDTAAMYLTASGGAIVNTASSNPGDASFIFGFKQTTMYTSQLAGSYVGLFVSNSSGPGEKVKPIAMTITAGSGTLSGTGRRVEDPSTGALSTDSATMSLTNLNSPSAGLAYGTLTMPNGSAALACMAVGHVLGTTRNIINCSGVDPGDSTKLFNFILTTKQSSS